MVETFGMSRGITPSVSKGAKRGNIRYNINEGITTSYSGAKKNGEEYYKEVTRARISDLAYYLGDDWIDWKVIKNYGGHESSSRKTSQDSKKVISSVPLRCSKCNKAFETKSMGCGTRITGNNILPDSIFKNVPLDKGECGLCDG